MRFFRGLCFALPISIGMWLLICLAIWLVGQWLR